MPEASSQYMEPQCRLPQEVIRKISAMLEVDQDPDWTMTEWKNGARLVLEFHKKKPKRKSAHKKVRDLKRLAKFLVPDVPLHQDVDDDMIDENSDHSSDLEVQEEDDESQEVDTTTSSEHSDLDSDHEDVNSDHSSDLEVQEEDDDSQEVDTTTSSEHSDLDSDHVEEGIDVIIGQSGHVSDHDVRIMDEDVNIDHEVQAEASASMDVQKDQEPLERSHEQLVTFKDYDIDRFELDMNDIWNRCGITPLSQINFRRKWHYNRGFSREIPGAVVLQGERDPSTLTICAICIGLSLSYHKCYREDHDCGHLVIPHYMETPLYRIVRQLVRNERFCFELIDQDYRDKMIGIVWSDSDG
jgi:hypothetical protein